MWTSTVLEWDILRHWISQILPESRGILTCKKPGFPSHFKIWSLPLTLSLQSRPHLYFLFSSWISPASPKHFLLSPVNSLLPHSAFSQLFVLMWRISSNLISVSGLTLWSQLIKFFIYISHPLISSCNISHPLISYLLVSSSPPFPGPALLSARCYAETFTSSPCPGLYWSMVPLCKPGLLSPGSLLFAVWVLGRK